MTADDLIQLDDSYMAAAIRQAQQAAAEGEVPVGAILTHQGGIIGRAHNQVELLKDPTAHAEILAITQAAAAIGDWRLTDTVLYVTKEPCPMCAGAIILARIPRVVWGVNDPRRGGGTSVFNILDNPALNHRCDITAGFHEERCRELLVEFFQRSRERSSDSD